MDICSLKLVEVVKIAKATKRYWHDKRTFLMLKIGKRAESVKATKRYQRVELVAVKDVR